ncbi:MAG: hypothetical protein Q8M18_03740 [Bradyrhizobium sp.]|nr:hypothetical protein [Bradyrhizobium sp.]
MPFRATAEYIKTAAQDHRLNRGGDVIVKGLPGAVGKPVQKYRVALPLAAPVASGEADQQAS